MDYFIDKTCTIQGVTIVNIDGEDTKSYEVVYSSTPCDFFGNQTYGKTQEARETESQKYTVVMLGNKNLCERGQTVSVVDNNGNDLGNYVVESVMFYPDISGTIDNTTLFVTQRDVG